MRHFEQNAVLSEVVGRPAMSARTDGNLLSVRLGVLYCLDNIPNIFGFYDGVRLSFVAHFIEERRHKNSIKIFVGRLNNFTLYVADIHGGCGDVSEAVKNKNIVWSRQITQ